MTKPYYLGVDVGGTKTHALVTTGDGLVAGFGEDGPGNHQEVGYAGLAKALDTSISSAMQAASIHASDLGGAGFGIAGYDWPSEREKTN